MDFYSTIHLVVLIIFHCELSIGETRITCKPSKEGTTTHIYIIKPKDSDIIISKSQPREEIILTCKHICKKENAIILQSNVIKSPLNDDYDNVTLFIDKTTKAKVEETVKEISCHNITVSGGLNISCKATNVSHMSKCYYELNINGIQQDAMKIMVATEKSISVIEKYITICTLHIPKVLLTSGVYEVFVTFYPVYNGNNYIFLGTKTLFTFHQVGPDIELLTSPYTVTEDNNKTCMCTTDKTSINSLFWYYENSRNLGIPAKVTTQTSVSSVDRLNTFWFGFCVGLATGTVVIAVCVSVYCIRRRIVFRNRRRIAKSHAYDHLNLQSGPHKDIQLNANYLKFEYARGKSENANQGSVYDEAGT
ncbi:hypothetical protein Btru_069084 [Bulinus truncatus]|nr:hypothetical protein Btru_069084 [Bulinus truncatus]